MLLYNRATMQCCMQSPRLPWSAVLEALSTNSNTLYALGVAECCSPQAFCQLAAAALHFPSPLLLYHRATLQLCSIECSYLCYLGLLFESLVNLQCYMHWSLQNAAAYKFPANWLQLHCTFHLVCPLLSNRPPLPCHIAKCNDQQH